MKNKLVLATVNAKKTLYGVTADRYASITPNVHLGLLAAYARAKGIRVEPIDSEVNGLSMEDLIGMMEETRPLLTGFICSGDNPSSSTMIMAGIVDFFQKFKARLSGLRTFIWGPHPTVLPKRSLLETGTDFIVRGEGYQTIVDLFNALKENEGIDNIPGLAYFDRTAVADDPEYVQTRDAPLIQDLDSLPLIDWDRAPPSKCRAHNWHCFDDLSRRSPYAVIWTSFGCPFKCSFCCINNLFGRQGQRFRSINSVIEEISVLVERHGVRNLKILDELFVVNPKRIEEFCDKLEARAYDLNMWCYARLDTVNRSLLKKMKKVGINWVSYGFESAVPWILKNIRKEVKCNVGDVIQMTRDEGIWICADVMFGLPDDDLDSITRTYEFLVENNFEWANMYPVFAYPGTELYRNIEPPASWHTYELYGYECVPAGTKYLSPEEVLRFRDQAFIKYYRRDEYLTMVENVFGSQTKEEVKNMAKIPLSRRILES